MVDFKNHPTYLGEPLAPGDASYVTLEAETGLSAETLLSVLISRGATADRPAPSIPGRLYFDTERQIMYRDNGTGWDSVEGTAADAMVNPMTSAGDLIYGGASGVGNLATTAAGATFTDGGHLNSPGSPLSNAFDENDSTHASYNAGGPRWVAADFGIAKEVESYRVYQSAGSTQRISDGLLQYSTDGLTWTTLVSLGAFGTDTTITPCSATTAQYWRLYSTSGASAVWQLNSLELYGSVADGTPLRLPIGSDGDVLTVVSGLPDWAAPGGGSGIPASTVDAKGDLIAGTANGRRRQ